MYVHQRLKGLASPVLWQELNTVAQVSDLLLRCKVASWFNEPMEATLKRWAFRSVQAA